MNGPEQSCIIVSDIHPRTKTKGPAQLADRENIDYWMEKGMEELNKVTL